MKIARFYILISCTFVTCAMAQVAQNLTLPSVDVTVHVIDQNGGAVAGATVMVAGATSPNSTPDILKNGVTDGGGIFETQLKSNGEISIFADKESYYRTEIPNAYDYQEKAGAIEKAFEKGKWGSVKLDVPLKKIIDPILLYARRFEGVIPAGDQPVGFDLEKGEWVAPYGKGSTSDLVFLVHGKVKSRVQYEGTLKLSFSNKSDGIQSFSGRARQGSFFRSAYQAPEDGYEGARSWEKSRRTGADGQSDDFVETANENTNYYLRLRSKEDEKGRIISALYGKIYDDVVFDPRSDTGHGYIKFKYYLNPTANDRNVEFDPTKNLFSGLKTDEQTTEP